MQRNTHALQRTHLPNMGYECAREHVLLAKANGQWVDKTLKSLKSGNGSEMATEREKASSPVSPPTVKTQLFHDHLHQSKPTIWPRLVEVTITVLDEKNVFIMHKMSDIDLS